MDNRIAAIIAKHLENLVLLASLELLNKTSHAMDACSEITLETQKQSKLLKEILTSLNSAPPPTSIPEDGADSPAGALSTPGGASPDLRQREYCRKNHPVDCDCDWCFYGETKGTSADTSSKTATHPVTCHCEWCTENQTDEGMGGDAILDRNVP